MKKINLVTSLIGTSILAGSTMAITSCGYHQSKRDDNPAKIANLFSSSALVKPVNKALTTKTTTEFSKVTINDFDQSMIKYDKTNKVATVTLSGTVAIANVGVNYYTLTLAYNFNNKVYSASAITLNINGDPYNVAMITKESATVALKNQVEELSTFSNVDISVDSILLGNIATGHISYRVYYKKYEVASHYIMSNLNFKVALKFNQASKKWITNDLNSLINPNKALAMSFAKIDYASYNGVMNRLQPRRNMADKYLQYQYAAPAHLNNWTDTNTKGLTPAQVAKIKATNLKAIDTKLVGDSLVVSYRAHAITTALTDKLQRNAYNFTYSKTWDFNDAKGYQDHGSISNISATLTEATKHYIFTLPNKTLTNNTHLVAKPNVTNSWSVVVNGKTIATVSFDPLQTDLKKDWSVIAI